MSSPSPIVKTRLKSAMHARFLAEQKARGLSESELLRQALHRLFEPTPLIQRRPAPTDDSPNVGGKPDHGAPAVERKTVWMPAFLMRAASAQAVAKGMSFSRWISALVQSNLMRHPVLTTPELLAIEAASRELAALGRNIHHIARSLTLAHVDTERIRLDKLAALSEKIAETQETIGALVRASRHAWRAE